jgi:hypothetical protein
MNVKHPKWAVRFYFKSERRKPLFFLFYRVIPFISTPRNHRGWNSKFSRATQRWPSEYIHKIARKSCSALILENFKGRRIRGSVITLVYCPPRPSRIIFDLIYCPPRSSRTIFDRVFYPPRLSRIIFAPIYCPTRTSRTIFDLVYCPTRTSRTIFASVFVYTNCVANKIIVIITLR